MKKQLLEKYSDNYKLRALISLVPNIGGALDILLSEKGTKWREERIMTFLTDLESKISKIESSLSKNFLEKLSESEELYDSVMQSFNSVIKTRHKEKIECYSNVLINQAVSNKTNEISVELILSVLDSITLAEIEYVSKIINSNSEIIAHKIFGQLVDWNKCSKIITDTSRIPHNQNELNEEYLIKFDSSLIWKLLSDKNIITIDTHKGFEYLNYSTGNSNMRVNGQLTSSERIEYKLTDFGKHFAEWIINY